MTAGRADSCSDARCPQAGPPTDGQAEEDPVRELLVALTPFVTGSSLLEISQSLYKALYRVHTAHLRGLDPGEFIARLASGNPDRIKIPGTRDGQRLRAALHGIRRDLRSEASARDAGQAASRSR
ncbi:hypothetical protein [Streptomyces sp. ZL-24]|uniref:hypothetical protein n=1 Tax=Streptomyces sp. ZL-24 TaxID=1933029 RepID=UPI0011AFF508|nr:hypothetical protein [Streptomyces sp. ZL-24]